MMVTYYIAKSGIGYTFSHDIGTMPAKLLLLILADNINGMETNELALRYNWWVVPGMLE